MLWKNNNTSWKRKKKNSEAFGLTIYVDVEMALIIICLPTKTYTSDIIESKRNVNTYLNSTLNLNESE